VQKTLFGEDAGRPMAKARRTDPDTSHEAAATVNATGTAGGQRMACLAYLTARPGQQFTAAEIANALGMERHAPSRRLPELRKMGLVKNGPARTCRVQNTQSLTWMAESQ